MAELNIDASLVKQGALVQVRHPGAGARAGHGRGEDPVWLNVMACKQQCPRYLLLGLAPPWQAHGAGCGSTLGPRKPWQGGRA